MKATKYVPGSGMKVPEGAKVFMFTRHGQGYHNLDENEKKYAFCEVYYAETGHCKDVPEFLLDPGLTELGVEQTKALEKFTSKCDVQPEVVIVSPLRRTIQTALNTFSHLVDGKNKMKVPFVAKTNSREKTGRNMWDKRRKLSEIKKDFPMIDYSDIKSEEDDLWTSKRETAEQVAVRARKLMVELGSRKEKVIAICSHSGLLKQLFGQVLDHDEKDWATTFSTGEMRIACVQSSQWPPAEA
eukprot:CAMPEP_0170167804 /NCGR_PEP_ID=MMETSP0040_2-20121228/1099_1 /TAXON_ID=641309 /ORGANISM="Lotharella oceanica, Strain CCMP622" /LENGTH=241 /DNA_ID=CAMNT_0010405935 /DNA_START=289 /DNA_END=1014 /DNA_ORIENTATION=-